MCDELPNLFIRIMLEVPTSTPKVALRVETGMLGMKQRIWVEKLRRSGSKSLSGKIYIEQLERGGHALQGRWGKSAM